MTLIDLLEPNFFFFLHKTVGIVFFLNSRISLAFFFFEGGGGGNYSRNISLPFSSADCCFELVKEVPTTHSHFLQVRNLEPLKDEGGGSRSHFQEHKRPTRIPKVKMGTHKLKNKL